MRHALWLKFIAVMLCAAGLVAAVGGGRGLALLAHEDLLGSTGRKGVAGLVSSICIKKNHLFFEMVLFH